MKIKLGVLVGVAFASTPAFAQSSVTMYGIISNGLGYVSNQGGHSNWTMISGANQNNRLGFKLTEDLGGGLSAVGTLENGFDSNTGKLGQGGRMFGRQAFVGLSSATYGTITFGRQYDVLWDYLNRIEPQAMGPGLGVSVGSNDNIEGNFRYNNAVKYASPVWGGFGFDSLYAFSNKAGSFQQNRAFSAGVNFDRRTQRYSLVYVQIDHPGTANPAGAVSDDYAGGPFQLFHTSPLSSSVGVRKQRVIAGGAEYRFDKLGIAGIVSDVRYNYLDTTSLHLDNLSVVGAYQLNPALSVSVAYLYTHGSYGGVVSNPHWNQGQLSVDYFFSKRTDVFAYANYIRASGSNAPAVLFLSSPSSNREQAAVVAGIRHKF
ncbi:porin [Paraburkholderia sp. MMS20-SJTR3]|uniref:Porin n=1 Tax=Paraburkholderia sejongensis TaxID=2886946 RepID=A0ABS8K1C0_9BURK|nr:porin [Paraburkholderia sp. MMS20-SJTR3]MCC8395820.1 porin [Paraburkholderia sp. MMS20-SJTR3]